MKQISHNRIAWSSIHITMYVCLQFFLEVIILQMKKTSHSRILIE